MTVEQARSAVSDVYQGRLDSGRVVIFASQEIADSVDVEQQLVQDQAVAEQLSFEEAQRSKKLWVKTPGELGATLPVDDLADEAFSYGRHPLQTFERLKALFGGYCVVPRATYDEGTLESLACDIDSAIGDPRVDFGLKVVDGKAIVTEGHDGMMVDRNWLRSNLDSVYFAHPDGEGSFVAVAEHAPLRVDRASAERAVAAINDGVLPGASFSFDGKELRVAPRDLISWISVRVDSVQDGFVLRPYVDADRAVPALVARMNDQIEGHDVAVTFAFEGDKVEVIPDSEVTVPLLSEALDLLDMHLFGHLQAGSAQPDPAQIGSIEVPTKVVSGPLSFEDALSFGIVSEVSSYTTQFVGSAYTKNRTHNIHLVSDLIDNSIASANGGKWSFNEVAGNCNEDAGFLPAGAITGDEYIEEAGGGICQVATTVFNAVYEAGYTVVSRSNHSLYVASYPAGRDAAVSYPYLDFVWRNDTPSDVLLKASYTDSSITVTLFGVSPRYSVSTDTGEWIEGEKHKTETKTDETLEPGKSVVKTAGTDGMKITVVRTVKDASGAVVRQDTFTSIYAPVTEVILEGPKPENSDDKDEVSKDKDKVKDAAGA